MNPDVPDTPHDYLVGFGRTLARIVLTGPGGLALPGDGGITSIIDLIVTMRDLGKKVMLIGNGSSALNERHHELEVNGSIRGGELLLTWTYSRAQHERAGQPAGAVQRRGERGGGVLAVDAAAAGGEQQRGGAGERGMAQGRGTHRSFS